MPLPVLQPGRVTLMIKPVGSACNLRCHYCYYLRTRALFAGSQRRMSLATLESLFAGYLPHAADQVTIAWQGGEPTLAGLPFFEKAVQFQQQHRRPDQRVVNALQTNGLFLDDAWCRFLRHHQFLVGISIDGARATHDAYRHGPEGEPSHAGALRGLKRLKGFGVEHNVLCVLHDRNVRQPREVWNAMISLGQRWLQFIPAIEWDPPEQPGGEPRLAPFSPRPRDYGRFLCDIFDLWFGQYRDHVSVQLFDAVLSKLVSDRMPLCIHAETCSHQLTIEHNGDVFGCDHFVERPWQLGRINPTHAGPEERCASGDEGSACPSADPSGPPPHPLDRAWFTRLNTTRFTEFALLKADLPSACAACRYRPFCHGGCTKHRPHRGAVAERTVLCEGYRMFFDHAMPRLRWLAEFIRLGVQPPPAEGDPFGKPRPPRPSRSATPRPAGADKRRRFGR